ncbi:glycosyltransferase family 2 protein [Qipengyuania seohaensis]|uniref:glycosyltransferase family 2 protein n=1 Tax=Qipengyuania seohaensis TaxID=266951 RepID=UPI000C227564|nr:glycosyltransferase family A protein [Qipengyuania seohaensis]
MIISAVVPCYNAQAYLGPALTSLLIQKRPPDEIIVADNGSTDDSRAIARSFGKAVRVIEVNERGANFARLAGVRKSRGDGLMFFDADDLLTPNALASLEEALIDNRGQIACCDWKRLVAENDSWQPAPASCLPRLAGQDDLAAWLGGWYQPPCSVLWSRGAYEKSGGWDPGVQVNQDGDIMMRAFLAGNSLVRAKEGCAFYRKLPEESSSVSAQRATPAGLESRLDVLDTVTSRLETRSLAKRYAGDLRRAYSAVRADIPRKNPALSIRCHNAILSLEDLETLNANLTWRMRMVWSRLVEPINSRSSFGGGNGMPTIQTLSLQMPGNATGPTPFVSVVVPTFNRAKSIKRTILSILAQDYTNFELIVVDDCSTDDTDAQIRAIADPRLRVIRLEANAGVGAARNRGIAEAQGELIAFCDSDDFWHLGKLRTQALAMQASSVRVGMTYTGIRISGAGARNIVERPEYGGELYSTMLVKNVVKGGGTTVMFRKSALELTGGYDTSLPAIEDYDLMIRISRFFEIGFIGEPLATYFDGEEQIGVSAEGRLSQNHLANRIARGRVFERYHGDMQKLGVDNLYLMDSAKRELDSQAGSITKAVAYALKAWVRRPANKYFYRWVVEIFGKKVSARIGGSFIRAFSGSQT